MLRGHTRNRPPSALEIALLDREQAYAANLSLSQLDIQASGAFEITIDSSPALGRKTIFRPAQPPFRS